MNDKGFFRSYFSLLLDYSDISSLSQTCKYWNDTCGPCLGIIREWTKKWSPNRFLREAIWLDDYRLVRFAVNVLGAKKYFDFDFQSEDMINYSENIKDSKLITSVSPRYSSVELLIIGMCMTDAVELLMNDSFTNIIRDFPVMFLDISASYGSWKCLDYIIGLLDTNIFRFPLPVFFGANGTRNFRVCFEETMDVLFTPKYTPYCEISSNRTFLFISILNNSFKYYLYCINNYTFGDPDWYSMEIAILGCRSREILWDIYHIQAPKLGADFAEYIRKWVIKNGDKTILF